MEMYTKQKDEFGNVTYESYKDENGDLALENTYEYNEEGLVKHINTVRYHTVVRKHLFNTTRQTLVLNFSDVYYTYDSNLYLINKMTYHSTGYMTTEVYENDPEGNCIRTTFIDNVNGAHEYNW